MTLQKGVLVLFFLMDASSGKLIFPLPRWPPIVERAGYVRAAPVCTCARTRKSEARRTVVDQQGPLRGSRTDFIQHLSFFYSKMTDCSIELARCPHMPASSDPVHPEEEEKPPVCLPYECGQCPLSNCWLSFLGTKWECFRRE